MVKILYEDNHLLAAEKERGVLTQPSGTDQESLESILKAFIKKRDQKPGNVYLHAIFRLDKEVGGIVLFAKTSKALTRLQKQQRERSMKKVYTALVEGEVKRDQGIMEDYLFHDNFRSKVVEKGDPGAKRACLSYSVLKKKRGKTVLSIILETGRYHQIRSQLASRGYPIVGDRKYGSRVFLKRGIALHHTEYSFEHPISGERVVIRSDFPLEVDSQP